MSRPLATLAALLVVFLVAPVAPASAETYGPEVPTETTIEVDAQFDVGEDVDITVEVKANVTQEDRDKLTLAIDNGETGPNGGMLNETSAELRGTLEVLLDGGDAAATATRPVTLTFDYDGQPITHDFGPQAVGGHVVSASFTPDDDTIYLPSHNTNNFSIVTPGSNPGAPVDQPDNNGILPNTGGFSVWWLLAALLLMVGGGTAVFFSRRTA